MKSIHPRLYYSSYKIYFTPDNYNEQYLDLFKIIKEGLPIGISGFISHSVINSHGKP